MAKEINDYLTIADTEGLLAIGFNAESDRPLVYDATDLIGTRGDNNSTSKGQGDSYEHGSGGEIFDRLNGRQKTPGSEDNSHSEVG